MQAYKRINISRFTMNKLSVRETFALGFMAFALFLGAGNIIFPPFIELQAGSNVWTAAAGFLVTGVGLPVLSVIALVKTGGEMGNIISSVGKATCKNNVDFSPEAARLG